MHGNKRLTGSLPCNPHSYAAPRRLAFHIDQDGFEKRRRTGERREGMQASLRIFATHAPEYADADLAAFPVHTRKKRPAVKGWQSATLRKTLAWASSEKLGSANGLGIVMGKESGITEVDVDDVGHAYVARAIEQFGETPILIHTATGKAKLWYRHNGEARRIRPIAGQPIDILGSGYTIAPPSWREDLEANYRFVRGGLEDLGRLPCIRCSETSFESAPDTVPMGQRNDSLWRFCMTQARNCDDLEALIDVGATYASCFHESLPANEVERCARSAWNYETSGRNFLGMRKPQLGDGDLMMDGLIDAPDAYFLYHFLQRWHRGLSHFAIAPRAMSDCGTLPWSWRRIAKARDVLVERGYLQQVSAPNKGRRKAGRYQFTRESENARFRAQS